MKVIPVSLVLFFLYSCISFAPQKSEMLTTEGKIIESRVEKKWKYRSIYMSHNDFHIIVKYEYAVNGIKYYSDKISYWYESFNSGKKAESALTPYPLGKTVTVYYKKENPNISYLQVEDDTKEDSEE